MRTSEELAWLAGFVDGDGSIFISHHKNTGCYSLVLSVSQNNVNVLRHVEERFFAQGKRSFATKNYQHGLTDVTGANAKAVIASILPHLVGKRAQAELALAFPCPGKGCPGMKKADLPALKKRQKEFYLRMHELNSKWSKGKVHDNAHCV